MGASVMDVLSNYNPAGFVLKNQGQAASNDDLRAQAQQRQAQAQQEQMKTQLAQVQLRDQDVLGRAFRDAAGDPDKTATLAIQYGVSPQGFMNYRDSHIKLQQGIATLTKEQQENEARMNQQVSNGYAALLQLPQEQRTAAAPGIFKRIQELDPKHPLVQSLDDDTLKTEIAKRGYMGTILDQAKTQAQTEKDQAETDKAKAETGKTNVETDKTKRSQAFQSLSAVNDENSFNVWKVQHPEIPAPAVYSPEWVKMQIRGNAVPVADQPKYDLEGMRAQNGILGNSEFETQFLPAYAAKLGKTIQQLTPDERLQSFSAYKQYNQDPEMRQMHIQSMGTLAALHAITAQNASNARGEQSYRFHAGELDRMAKPIEDLSARFGRLQDTLNQNTPAADALIAPELLSVMSGGQGSGLRMNQTEINAIVGGRSAWESLQAKINKIKLDPNEANSITPAQRTQIRALVAKVGEKLQQKQAIISQARQGLAASNDPMEHRGILLGMHDKVNAIDNPAQPQASTGGYQQGHVYGGLEYLGGDPKQAANWKKAQ